MAEQGKAWLQQVAGHVLVHRARELTDPVAALRQPPPAAAARPAPIQLPPEIHEELYRHWADQPVPALGGLSPRQAIRTPGGRREVVDLLKEYELQDQHSAREQGLEPASWRFLWKQLGLSPK
jgi:hypothetical protein